MNKFKKGQKILSLLKGFSLLELLIVLSITVLIASIGVGFYVNYGKSVEISSVAKTVDFDLKQAQSKAMIGEGGFKWGAHFVNGTTDYYEIFSTPTDYNDAAKVIISTSYLGSGVTFSNPANGASADIIFNKISGGTPASSVDMVLGNITKTISISGVGNITMSDSGQLVPATTLTGRVAGRQMQLEWTNVNATGYSVYRGTTNGGPYTKIVQTPSTQLVYIDAGLTVGTTYYWVVRSLDADLVEVAQSNQVSATASGR